MSTLRPLVKPPITFAPAAPTGRRPKLDFLPLSLLCIDDQYQRQIDRRGQVNIVNICSNFDWSRFAPLIVARVPGKDHRYAIIDGQHRATAALVLGIEKVPCAIVEASTQEQPAIFAAVNGNVTPVTIFQLFKAARAAKAEWALMIDQACAIGGIVPLIYPKAKREIKPFETMALGTLRQAIIRFGVDEVGAAIKHAKAQPGTDEPGFWNSSAIKYAIDNWRGMQGKRSEPAAPSGQTMADRIRELRKKGHTRFAIQAALRCRLSDIEAALEGAP